MNTGKIPSWDSKLLSHIKICELKDHETCCKKDPELDRARSIRLIFLAMTMPKKEGNFWDNVNEYVRSSKWLA